DYSVDLVADEEQQKGDHPGIRPELVPQQRRNQHDLDGAMRQEVKRREQDRPLRQAMGGVEEPSRDEVMRVLRQLVLGECSDDAIDRRRTHQQEDQATDDLQNTIKALEDDRDLKGPVEQIPASGCAHDVGSMRRRASDGRSKSERSTRALNTR